MRRRRRKRKKKKKVEKRWKRKKTEEKSWRKGKKEKEEQEEEGGEGSFIILKNIWDVSRLREIKVWTFTFPSLLKKLLWYDPEQIVRPRKMIVESSNTETSDRWTVRPTNLKSQCSMTWERKPACSYNSPLSPFCTFYT